MLFTSFFTKHGAFGSLPDEIPTEMTVAGESSYTIAGTYEWTAPAGVTSVSVVCIGAGGIGGFQDGAASHGAGGGGGLGYKNTISVTPGQKYTVVVGDVSTYGSTANSGDSYFISPSLVKGGGGGNGAVSSSPGGTGGTFIGDGGGNGGRGAAFNTSMTIGLAGGGAGGYSGNGGIGGFSTYSGTDGAGGGAGGGYGGTGGSGGGYGGGGVGIYGQGASGTGGTSVTLSGRGGSGGANGSTTSQSGGKYGGGYPKGVSKTSGEGIGAVRIIWPGTVRLFPSTYTWESTPVATTNISLTTFSQYSTITPFTPVTGSKGIPPYTFSISPALPDGLVLNTATGAISGTISSSSVSALTTYTISISDSYNNIGSSTFSLEIKSVGQVEFTTPGSYNWIVPDGVTNISMVTVGGGGIGNYTSPSRGGGGGALSYRSNITVTPGSTVAIVVGDKGRSAGSSGSFSSVTIAGAIVCKANGGGGATSSAAGAGGTFVAPSDGGGAGGTGGSGTSVNSNTFGGGAGGAGGYSGKGGNGGSGGLTSAGSGSAGATGSGAGGGGSGAAGGTGTVGGGASGGRGGGVGIYGAGATGAAIAWGPVQPFGTDGNPGSNGAAGYFGAGGHYSETFKPAGTGAVRIIWPAPHRQYPSTRTANE